MNVQQGDTVLVGDRREVGIVAGRNGSMLHIRFPEDQNRRDQIPRTEVRALAEAMYEARQRGTKFSHSLSLTGNSTLSDLVAAFGYSTARLRRESLDRVLNQLLRAGLEVRCSSDRWDRDDNFSLAVSAEPTPEPEATEEADSNMPPLLSVSLPDPFWPTALGLDPNCELAFLRSLTGSAPLLCLLNVPGDVKMQVWLQATWEGLLGWAYRAAQRFNRHTYSDGTDPEILIGPAPMLHTYLKASVLGNDVPNLRDRSHCLNLVALKADSDFPVDYQRLRAVWPGTIFEFKPQPALSGDGQASADVAAVLRSLLLAGGLQADLKPDLSPVKTLLWSKEASAQIMARGSIHLGRILASGEIGKFKGSNEGAIALAIKADLARWIQQAFGDADLEFEESEIEECDASGSHCEVRRIDLLVPDKGRFEVESLVGSGPIEAFYHQKVFSRIGQEGAPLWLVVPNEAVLWAGPYLADVAHHVGSNGHVLIPGAEGAYLELQGKALDVQEFEMPWTELSSQYSTATDGNGQVPTEATLRLRDFVGYSDIVARVDELIIWPEKHRRAIRRPSRSSGILFFGPPGCGKSRLARAIAGELEEEVRLLSPSDLRGAYIGWGQVLIREQFDWVADNERRMLVIDEIDAVARSRRDIGNMHEDEKASVNELLVQLDRVSRLGRLVVGTTNYVDSLDEAVLRSGRFGRFVPIPPPGLDESIQILEYYLHLLAAADKQEDEPTIRVPMAAELRCLLDPLFAESRREGRFFCGADLEEAVNRTYLRCLRQVLGDAWREGYGDVVVELTLEELSHSLKDVPRSVSKSSVQQFLDDVTHYCGRTIAGSLSKDLGVG